MPDGDILEVEIPIEGESEKKMAGVDPEIVATNIIQAGAQAHQLLMNESGGNIQNVNNLARLTGVKKFDELQAAESSSIEKVLNSPKTT
ncbi:hypothetical protein [Gimesia maris]|uniref:hypothetical protein n=1 Tax=Gimesia maris TaxID=122 RepID=UPI00241D7E0A|nr:hypothetical protein [Gimesia maris]|tara:strand:+ start:290 stop:556 length:267 start_codon:yes stop_codon:yes gene_type:complete